MGGEAGNVMLVRASTWAGLPPRAAYAADASSNLGRVKSEPDCTMRSPFGRDRDRVLHSTAFRRLTYKTQVFVFHEGDHFRTRLTHTLEVAQIARALARQLGLDEDLAEALALAHDLGHPPFGHAGERALNVVMAPFGGFDHNAQSLKVVTSIEKKYAGFDGLNLTFETLEGLVKHNGPILDGSGRPLAVQSEGAGHGVMMAALEALGLVPVLNLGQYASAEAQVAALADDIAYYNHDLDDGLRAGLIALSDLDEVPLAGPLVFEARRTGTTDESRLIYEVNRRLITFLITDALAETRRRVEHFAPRSLADIKSASQALVGFSSPVVRDMGVLKAFLRERVWRHARVMHVMRDAELIVRELFIRYLEEPVSIPRPWGPASATAPKPQRAAMIADFVAGMTDRFALDEHRRLFALTPSLR